MDRLTKFFKAAWEYVKLAKIELIVLAATVAVDLISKAIVAANIPLNGSVTIIPNLLNFTYIRNYAAAFGSRFGIDKLLGETGTSVFFIVITFVAIGFFGYFMYRNRKGGLLFRLAFALIIGGAIGNLVDRMALGYVRDFVQIVYLGLTLFGSTSFAIFNLADAALCVGVALFLVYYIFIYKDEKQPEAAEPALEQNGEELTNGDERNDKDNE